MKLNWALISALYDENENDKYNNDHQCCVKIFERMRRGEIYFTLYLIAHTQRLLFIKERTTASWAYHYFHAQIDYQSGREHDEISRQIWAHFEISMNLCCSKEKKEENYYTIKAQWLFRKTDRGSEIYSSIIITAASKIHFTFTVLYLHPFLAILL